jgi:hypothetical protein
MGTDDTMQRNLHIQILCKKHLKNANLDQNKNSKKPNQKKNKSPLRLEDSKKRSTHNKIAKLSRRIIQKNGTPCMSFTPQHRFISTYNTTLDTIHPRIS